MVKKTIGLTKLKQDANQLKKDILDLYIGMNNLIEVLKERDEFILFHHGESVRMKTSDQDFTNVNNDLEALDQYQERLNEIRERYKISKKDKSEVLP